MTFETRCEQDGCGDSFAEQLAQRLIVVVLGEHLLPGFLESHECAADLEILEYESLNLVQRLILQAGAAGPR